ncbi:hypothetical protein [Paenibacillus alvei]|uniref:hypothetical protein n=1 Tax=Paenibacillus alvei TaxID=44250 RepID=UPI0013DBAB6E|nr:hypothetical protein [Paenibacillus alvei]
MTNIERLKMETKGIALSEGEMSVYLSEEGLIPTEEYEPSSNKNKRVWNCRYRQVFDKN